MAKRCPECGEELPYDTAKFCPECGSKQTPLTELSVSVGRDVSGKMNVASRDVHVHESPRESETIKCGVCGGTGKKYKPCTNCGGKGRIYVIGKYMLCPKCNGNKILPAGPCPECKGHGKVRI